MKQITILGSTGSIGTQTLDIIGKNPDRYEVVGLAAGKNIALLKEQILAFHPRMVCLAEEYHAQQLRAWAKEQKNTQIREMKIVSGQQGATQVACLDEADLVVAAMVGAAGLLPTLEAIHLGKTIGLANKETMVVAGHVMNAAAKKSGAKILPIDSEHNALFQCMQGHTHSEIKRLILTASGGPFRNHTLAELANVTPKAALKHPNWDMGAKITIDSATMMNKGLEVIEAHFLFNTPAEQIDILIHPQSIVHSLVEYIDGSLIAELGIPDMRIPISFALEYPKRLPLDLPRLDLVKANKLEFFEPDRVRFPAIGLAYQALAIGQTMTAVLNAANEIAIPHFLEGKIGFMDIPKTVEQVMSEHEKNGMGDGSSLEDCLAADAWARKACLRLLSR